MSEWKNFREMYDAYKAKGDRSHVSAVGSHYLCEAVASRFTAQAMSPVQAAEYAIFIGYVLAREDMAKEVAGN